MARLLCVYENMIATVQALKDFLKQLSEYDNRINIKFITTNIISYSDIFETDILLLIRPNNSFFCRIAQLARRNDINIILYLDDDLANLPNSCIDIPWRKKGLIDTAKWSDIILSPNPYIASKYGEISKTNRIYTIDTSVYPESIVQHYNNNGLIKIVYAASTSHHTLFEKYIEPVLSTINEKYSSKISLTFMGVHPEINTDNYQFPIEYIGALPLDKYREKIKKMNFDIGLAPLDQTDFTRCKYFNKFIEYSMFGIVGVYSNVEPYTFVVQNEINGFLADNTPSGWLSALSNAIENNTLVGKCREGSYKVIINKFDPSVIMNKLISDIPELVEAQKKIKVHSVSMLLPYKILYLFSRFGDWIYKSIYYLKHGGIKELMKNIKRHFDIQHNIKLNS